MATIHVRDVRESVVTALRERAATHGRSMQQEIRQILSAAAAEPPSMRDVEPIRLHLVRAAVTSTWRREEIYGDAGG